VNKISNDPRLIPRAIEAVNKAQQAYTTLLQNRNEQFKALEEYLAWENTIYREIGVSYCKRPDFLN
jgi:hypothetical protein